MTYPSVYYVDRSTDTPTDTLLAFGLADLISHIIPDDEDWQLTIHGAGDGYKISLKDEIPSQWVDQRGFDFQIDAIGVKRKDKKTKERVMVKLPQGLRFIDYDEQKEQKNYYIEQKSKGKTPQELAMDGTPPPHPDWAHWAIINQMSAVDTYNKVVKLWYEHKLCFPPLLRLILELFSKKPNEVQRAIDAWQVLAKESKINATAMVSALQIIDPSMVEGGNSAKASWRPPHGLDSFWVLEYLKYVGFYCSAVPRIVRSDDTSSGKKRKDSGPKVRKTYILHPKSLAWATHSDLFQKFQTLRTSTAIKMDIVAVLDYCRIFVEQWRDGQPSCRFERMLNGQPGDHVDGIEVVTYKSLGKSFTTLDFSTLALPKWLPKVESREQATCYLDLLREHANIIRKLEEGKKGEEAELLRDYRNFLSSGDLRHFYRFTLGYSHVLTNRIKTGAYAPQFTLSNLEVLLMAHNKKLGDILQNRGFQRVASAIRQSTVTPQRAKANRNKPDYKGPNNPYEPRYGLGAELMRHAAYPDKFTIALNKFLFVFCQENNQVNERFNGSPPIRRVQISEEDIKQVVALIDDEGYGSETVASLLVACGYASTGKWTKQEEKPSEQESGDESDVESESDDEGGEE